MKRKAILTGGIGCFGSIRPYKPSKNHKATCARCGFFQVVYYVPGSSLISALDRHGWSVYEEDMVEYLLCEICKKWNKNS